ncbi:trypsin-like serine peptidase [Catenuloplanes japonicus]|uniref:trypsin-like serine peptidase n=1 Tax=Catenuloplanes japonicus TaxID=33876 RepID=UPI000526619E|nr:trypsin-like peptidase domain-containing protein [Catenuloplanes japonicus]
MNRYLDLISTGGGQHTLAESAATTAGNAAPAARTELIERLEAEVAYVESKTGVTADPALVKELFAQAGTALDKLLGEGESATLTEAEVSGLEAVVVTDGSRPVLFVEDDFVDLLAPGIGDYAAPISRLSEEIRGVCRSVGRVDDPAAAPLGYQGTAWVVGEGLVATNFHVLQAIAPRGTRADGQFTGRLNPGVAVHFGHEVGRPWPERRFPIRRVVSVGREGAPERVHPTLGGLNFDGLDLAILELEPVPGRPFPPPLPVARGDDPVTRGGLATAGRGVYLVGYPGNERSTTRELFTGIFAGVKSYKRLAPGRITVAAGDLTDDPRGWILAHDVSTLGGNSGSAVVDLDADGRSVLGLHFAGQPERQNWAHATERITTELASVL